MKNAIKIILLAIGLSTFCMNVNAETYYSNGVGFKSSVSCEQFAVQTYPMDFKIQWQNPNVEDVYLCVYVGPFTDYVLEGPKDETIQKIVKGGVYNLGQAEKSFTADRPVYRIRMKRINPQLSEAVFDLRIDYAGYGKVEYWYEIENAAGGFKKILKEESTGGYLLQYAEDVPRFCKESEELYFISFEKQTYDFYKKCVGFAEKSKLRYNMANWFDGDGEFYSFADFDGSGEPQLILRFEGDKDLEQASINMGEQIYSKHLFLFKKTKDSIVSTEIFSTDDVNCEKLPISSVSDGHGSRYICLKLRDAAGSGNCWSFNDQTILLKKSFSGYFQALNFHSNFSSSLPPEMVTGTYSSNFSFVDADHILVTTSYCFPKDSGSDGGRVECDDENLTQTYARNSNSGIFSLTEKL